MERKRLSPNQDVDDDSRCSELIEENGRSASFDESNLSSLEESSYCSDFDSLFDEEDSGSPSCQPSIGIADVDQSMRPARRLAPPIPGMHFNSTVLIPVDIAEQLWRDCMRTYFRDGDVNQVMLFERARSPESTRSSLVSAGKPEESLSATSRLPDFLLDLLDTLKTLLKDVLPVDVHTLLFPLDSKSHQARQAILNHYMPGEGIAPHVDLLNRYGDGIVGVSLHDGTVMDFSKMSNSDAQSILHNGSGRDLRDRARESYNVYLPERSVFVLTGEARYKWTHGIARRSEDLVESLDGELVRLLPRGERLSITFRWLLPGADIVGD
ncbi:hypothetical protein A7U60_g5742 [Sanghuangporus baumii]|uniref:Fe2OG dioxygenase domain-containing protein n=1 Tax=Sanghuangporus baumii TaxID=108892 RepID=A0A9Q5N383_SANBA|nr:hypothetical protein A7U60_g5742 [Sanghuangporus baumii]